MLLTFDFETTAPDPKVARPVQTALIQTDDNWNSTVVMNCLSNPGAPIPEGASSVHGIHDNDVALMPPATWTVAGLYNWLAWLRPTSPVLAGHNIIHYDIAVARNTMPDEREATVAPVLDSLLLARRYWPDADHKLSALHEWLGLGSIEGAHGAVQDCLGNVDIIRKLTEVSGKSVLELAHECATGRILKRFPFGKHKGKPMEDVPKPYLRWCAQNFTDLDADLRATLEHYAGIRIPEGK